MERPRQSKRKDPKQPSAAGRALRLLARRDHTRSELAAKLAPHVEDDAQLEALLDDLTRRGWLSEARVVEQVLHAKRGRLGVARIRQLLLQRGVAGPHVASAVATLKASELETARAVWSKKYRAAASSPAEQARQVRFLQSRGFSFEVAMRVTGARGRDNDEGA